MPAESDRDRPTDMERLLGQTMRAGMAPPTPECLDAERLAAWSDGALSAIEGFDVEQHLSTCERCQAMLAAYVRITGAEPEAAAVLPFWRRPAVRWMAPVAAAVAASVVWFAMPRSTPTIAPTTQMARVETSSDRGPATAPPREVPTTPAPSAPSRPAGRPSTGASNTDSAAGAQDMQYHGQLRGQPDSAPANKSAEGAIPIEPPQEVTVTAEVTPVQTATSSRTSALPPPALMARQAIGVVEIVPRSMTAPAAARAEADAAAVSSPVVRTRWQIRPDGTVVRILGDGGTPEPVTLVPPAPVTAGDASSPSECWLVGPNGMVWRTTEGLRFNQVPFPERAELAAVEATSAFAVSITTADGRRFSTANAGKTWQILQPR